MSDRILPQNVVPFLILLCLFSSTGISQTKWFKYQGNPVLEVGATGTWEGALVHTSRVIYKDSLYRMWYSGFLGTKYWNLGFATSPDGIKWTKHSANPVLQRGPSLWDSNGSHHAYVAFTGSKYEMWYNGGDASGDLRIGYATSADGINWRKAKEINPVLDVGPPGSWHSRGVGRASVLGPESGSYKMWFGGNGSDPGVVRIGYATASSPTSWSKNPTPVLTAGSAGAWDDYSVFFPRVIYNEGIYEMWYTGMRTPSTRRIGYATSRDGIHWDKHVENPVLIPGPERTWDSHVVLLGDVLFDGRFYHMWYQGLYRGTDAAVGRMGYAISPGGTRVTLSATHVVPGHPVHITLQLAKPLPLSFSAEIHSLGGKAAGLIKLFDDGNHGDGLASDGIFAHSWIPAKEENYRVDIRLEYGKKSFVLRDAGAFTTLGPIRFESMEFIGDSTPNPGDSMRITVKLRNHSATATAVSVGARLFSADSNIAPLSPSFVSYGDLTSGAAATGDSYGLFISPDCPSGKNMNLDLSISSLGVVLWRETFTLSVLPPWWRSNLAYSLYAFFLLVSVGVTIRYIEAGRLKSKIRRLEQEGALERERARISRDMHDEVGARLTEIGILSELAKKDIETPRKAEEQIQKISQASREVIASIGEIIWAINAQNASLDDLVAYLREYTSKFLGTTSIKCAFETPEVVPVLVLSEQTRRNVFLVVKETLHNIVKHSGATDVHVRIAFHSPDMEIIIEDHGKGFDPRQQPRFGNGLRNMHRRMMDIGGVLDISSSPGHGTKVTLRIKM